MTTRNNNGSVGGLAREIQRRLSEAQGAPAPEAAAHPSPPPTQPDNQGLRVTKDGRIVRPGEAVPVDEQGNPVAFHAIPDATFHLWGEQS